MTDPRAVDIVRSGRLRVGLFPSFFYTRDRATGELRGWGIEMARALSGRLGVALELIERPSPPDIVASLIAGECDVAFLGLSRERAALVDFSPPWVQADFTFLVPQESAVQRMADADSAAMRIAVVRNHAMEMALRGQLELAERMFADTPDAAFDLLQRGEANLLAGIRPGLIAYAALAPGARVLADRYGANVIGLAVAKDRGPWLSYVSAFVTASKANGDAASAAERAGTQGLEIAT